MSDHDRLSLGVIGQSAKENEHRLPIHPAHFERIAGDLTQRIYVEHGYGHRFGVSDEKLATTVAGLRTRDELVAECDVILLAKPLIEDLTELRTGQVLWGWPHCVQNEKITQAAIDRKLTLIAFEAMNHWRADGSLSLHVFHKNNELAGYSSVLHALGLAGLTGTYGRPMRAAVLGFGATARGAVTALTSHGIHDVTVLTHRRVAAVGSPIHSARIKQLEDDPDSSRGLLVDGHVPVAEFLAGHDVIVNCVLQDTDAPLMFMTDDDIGLLTPGTVIIDVSCDEAMGFSWARPTSFGQPTFVIGDNVMYYAVDHSPSYLWNSASWEISEALLPHLRTVLGGPRRWRGDETIRRAVEIMDGTIQNPAILSFQHRAPDYPHTAR